MSLILDIIAEEVRNSCVGRLFEQIPRPRSGFLMVTHPSGTVVHHVL